MDYKLDWYPNTFSNSLAYTLFVFVLHLDLLVQITRVLYFQPIILICKHRCGQTIELYSNVLSLQIPGQNSQTLQDYDTCQIRKKFQLISI